MCWPPRGVNESKKYMATQAETVSGVTKRIPYSVSDERHDLLKESTRGSGTSINSVIDASVDVYLAYVQSGLPPAAAAKAIRDIGNSVREAMGRGLTQTDVVEKIQEAARDRAAKQQEQHAPLKDAGSIPPNRPLDRMPDYLRQVLPFCRKEDGGLTERGRRELEAARAEIKLRQQLVDMLSADKHSVGDSDLDKLAKQIERAAKEKRKPLR